MVVWDLQGFRTKASLHPPLQWLEVTLPPSLTPLSFTLHTPLSPISTFQTFPSFLNPSPPPAHRAVILAFSSPPWCHSLPPPTPYVCERSKSQPPPLPFLSILRILGAVNGCRGNCLLQWGARTLVGATVTVLVVMENNAASSPPSLSVLSNHPALATAASLVFP